MSVITPSLNQADYIEETLQSVLAQDYSDFEHIVIDGGSTDHTFTVLERYPHVKWISEPDEGRADALNKGFRMAKGDIIAWINTDDYYTEGAFERVVRFFETNPEEYAYAGCAAVVNREGEFLFNQNPLFQTAAKHEKLICFWKFGTLPQPSLFFRRSVLEKIGFMKKEMHDYTDYDFVLRLSRLQPIACTPEVFSCIRIHDQAGSVQDILNGVLERKLLAISRQYWGRKSNFPYWKIFFSWLCHWPGVLWRAHYEKFAFKNKAEIKRMYSRNSFPGFIWESRKFWIRSPLCFLASALGFFRKSFLKKDADENRGVS